MSRAATCHPDRAHEAHGLCESCYKKARYAANPTKINERNIDRYRANPAPRVECSKAWAAANPEKVKEYKRRWDKANPVKANAWTVANREQSRIIKRRWNNANPEKRSEIAHRRRSRLIGMGGPGVNPEQWNELLETFNHHCAYCLQSSKKLSRDHIVPISCGGIDEITNVVPACRSCNSSKNNKSLLSFAKICCK